MMNHPFVGNIALLREMYGPKFSNVRFMVPFARLPDPDVITVYRGSYTHAAFLTDARRELSEIDCDYYLVVHDDVLLNPRISEETFRDYFPLGPDDGFHPKQGAESSDIGEWVWNFALFPRLFHPKSILFGGGIESADLAAFLPAPEPLRAKLLARQTPFRDAIRLSAADMSDVERQPSRVLLHGLTAGVPLSDPGQAEIEERSLELERTLIEVMLASARVGANAAAQPVPQGETLPLPLPLVTGGMYTDIYIVPKSRFDDFVHYVGVASAAHLFVEVMAPTILFAVCDRVWTADDFDLDMSGFPSSDVLRLEGRRVLAIHPYKLSVFKTPAVRQEFLEAMGRVQAGLPIGAPKAGRGRYAFGSEGPFADFGVSGWHGREPWGRWASGHDAVLHFEMSEDAMETLTLRFRAASHPNIGELTGRVYVNGEEGGIEVAARATSLEAVVDGAKLRPGRLNKLRIRSDTLVCPALLSMGSDQRELGLGLEELLFQPKN
jgi:hypothetical protein